MSHMIVTIHTDYSQLHKQQWLMSVVETKCVLCELGSEFYLFTVPHVACTFFWYNLNLLGAQKNAYIV
jgi:hypothetical protein